jgi:hypothetical protein
MNRASSQRNRPLPSGVAGAAAVAHNQQAIATSAVEKASAVEKDGTHENRKRSMAAAFVASEAG